MSSTAPSGLLFRKSTRMVAIGLLCSVATFCLTGPSFALAGGTSSLEYDLEHRQEIAGVTDNNGPTYTAVRADYSTPAVELFDGDGNPVRLPRLLSQPRLVLLQFIFTSCSTICPLMSATFSQAQVELDRLNIDYRMVSISLDPEYDTPEHLKTYAKRYHAGARWTFLTGAKNDVRTVLNAFDALYQSDNKMYHRPLFYLRGGSDAIWLRIEGFMNVRDLMKKVRIVLGESEVATR